jgi:hypothetical protein
MKKIKLTAKEIDDKFDAGREDIVDYFEIVKNDGLPLPLPTTVTKDTKKKLGANVKKPEKEN